MNPAPQEPSLKDKGALSDSEYWQTVAEIDATIFCIEQLARQVASRPPIFKMVDEATGWDKEQEKTLEYWSKRLKKLMAKLPPDDPHFKSAPKELL